MKVFVSHPAKQYVNALLTGLDRRGALVRFCTMFAAERFWPLRFFPGKWRSKFMKYAFREVDGARVRHAPVLFLLSNLVKGELWDVRVPYAWFDRWVARQLRRVDFDIVIGYETANLYTFAEAKRLGKVTVLDLAGVHHHFQNPVLIAAGVYRDEHEMEFITKKKDEAFAVTDYVLTLSTFAELALICAGYPAQRIFKTYLGVNLALFSPKKKYRTDPAGRLELYFVGTLSRRKAVPFALELVRELHHGRGLDVRLTLVGPVDDFDPAGLDPVLCRHLPFVPQEELVALHHALDLFVFPSNMDSWAQTVIEAMACGSPVMVSEHTGARDAVKLGGGLVLPVGDMPAWASAIETVYHDRFLLEKMGKAAIPIAQRYTWENYHEQVFAAMLKIKQLTSTARSSASASQNWP